MNNLGEIEGLGVAIKLAEGELIPFPRKREEIVHNAAIRKVVSVIKWRIRGIKSQEGSAHETD